MAVEENTRRMGCGKVLVINCIRYVVKKGGDLIWCNARVGSMPFYQALGFQAIGEEFDIAESGPHYVMWRKV
jgi:ribosomal protein S18 acetylase RimI-like enzyme